MGMTPHPCPVECGEGPFSSENGAVMHAINKNDEIHDSVNNKTDGYSRLADRDTTTDEESSGGSNDPPEDTSDDPDGSDVSRATFPGGEDDGGDRGEDGCPDCGSTDYYDADELAEHPRVSDDDAEVLAEHDRVCAECGEVYDG